MHAKRCEFGARFRGSHDGPHSLEGVTSEAPVPMICWVLKLAITQTLTLESASRSGNRTKPVSSVDSVDIFVPTPPCVRIALGDRARLIQRHICARFQKRLQIV